MIIFKMRKEIYGENAKIESKYDSLYILSTNLSNVTCFYIFILLRNDRYGYKSIDVKILLSKYLSSYC